MYVAIQWTLFLVLTCLLVTGVRGKELNYVILWIEKPNNHTNYNLQAWTKFILHWINPWPCLKYIKKDQLFSDISQWTDGILTYKHSKMTSFWCKWELCPKALTFTPSTFTHMQISLSEEGMQFSVASVHEMMCCEEVAWPSAGKASDFLSLLLHSVTCSWLFALLS